MFQHGKEENVLTADYRQMGTAPNIMINQSNRNLVRLIKKLFPFVSI